jgi:hypothetical protein
MILSVPCHSTTLFTCIIVQILMKVPFMPAYFNTTYGPEFCKLPNCLLELNSPKGKGESSTEHKHFRRWDS